jgi:hypothetical protein
MECDEASGDVQHNPLAVDRLKNWNCCPYSGTPLFHGRIRTWTRLGHPGGAHRRRRNGMLSPALTVVVQNSVPVARMGSATTSQQFIRQIGAALGVSAFVLAATVGGFRLGLLLMIAVSAGTFACVLALPAHSLHDAHQIDVLK